MSAIADLVVLLLSTGIPPETMKAAVDLAQQHGVEQVEIHRNSTGIPPETAADKRRAWDRERKRNSTGKQKPPLILPSLTTSEETLKEVSKEPIRTRASKKRAEPIPLDWTPSEHSYGVAEQHGVSVQIVEQIFRDYLKSSGKLYADYDAAFYNFLRNQRRFNGNGHNGTPQNKSVSAVAKRWAEQFESQSGDSLQGNPDAFLRLSQG